MTEREFIVELQKQKKELETRLEAIKNAIKGFGGNTMEDTSPTKEAPKRGRKKKEVGVKLPDAYDPDLPWKDKIMFIVNDLGVAFSEDITTEVMKREEELDKERTLKTVTLYSSKMYRDGIFKAKRIGRKYKYSIK